MKQLDAFINQYSETEKISAEFHALKSVYEFESEYKEDGENKKLLITSKEGATFTISSQRESADLNFFYQMAIKCIPEIFEL